MKHLTPVWILLLGTTLLPGVSRGDEPSPFQLVYRASSRGLSATAERRLVRSEDDHFILSNSMTVRVAGIRMGSVTERSDMRWQNQSLLPQAYLYQQTGIGGTIETVDFDWAALTAASSEEDEDWTLPLTPGVWDKLGYQLQLSRELMVRSQGDFEFQVLDTDEIEPMLYRVSGEEVLDTTVGKLNTLRLDRVRAPESRRQTTFWLARDWEMVLVKLVQVSGSGAETTLRLEHGQLGDREISGLP